MFLFLFLLLIYFTVMVNATSSVLLNSNGGILSKIRIYHFASLLREIISTICWRAQLFPNHSDTCNMNSHCPLYQRLPHVLWGDVSTCHCDAHRKASVCITRARLGTDSPIENCIPLSKRAQAGLANQHHVRLSCRSSTPLQMPSLMSGWRETTLPQTPGLRSWHPLVTIGCITWFPSSHQWLMRNSS